MAERKSKDRRFEVLVSFDGLDKGERFTGPADDWTTRHVETGYLLDVTDAPTAAEAQAGAEPPEADPQRVEEAKNAGEVSQG